MPEKGLPIPGVETYEVRSEGRVNPLARLVQMKNGEPVGTKVNS